MSKTHLNTNYINPKTGERFMYYDPEGKGIEDTLVWGRMLEEKSKDKTKWVGKENVCFGLFYVSTVWLGLDHNFSMNPKSPPLIYESMVFCRFPLPRLKNYEIGWKEIKFTFSKGRGRKKWHRFLKLPLIKRKETIFKGKFFNICSDLEMDRYSTKKQALAGHKRMVKNWSNPKHLDGHLIKHLFSKY